MNKTSFDRGLEEGREKGREEGREEGREKERHGQLLVQRAILTELLEAKFGLVSDDLLARVEAADADTLRRWVLAAGKADTLAVFRVAAES